MIFKFKADGDILTNSSRKKGYTGNISSYICKFSFSDDWDNLSKFCTFSTGEIIKMIPIGEDLSCEIPYEVLEKENILHIGILGTFYESGTIVKRIVTNIVSLDIVTGSPVNGADITPPDGFTWEEYYHKIIKDIGDYELKLNNSLNGHISDKKNPHNISYDNILGDFPGVIDKNYVHTHNDYTDVDKEKLDNLYNYDDTVITDNIAELHNIKADKLDLRNETVARVFLQIQVDSKVNKTDYASIKNAGIIKLHSSSNQNRSGLVVGENDGAVYVYTDENYGTNRSDDGRIQVVKADNDEIKNRSNSYKPIVPANLDLAVQSVSGDFTELNTDDKSNLVNAVNEVNGGKADKKLAFNGYIEYTESGLLPEFDEYTTAGIYKTYNTSHKEHGILIVFYMLNTIQLHITHLGIKKRNCLSPSSAWTEWAHCVFSDQLETAVNTKIDKTTQINDTVSSNIAVNLQANTVYQYGTLSSLTINSYEISNYETVIYFTSGDTATSLSIPSTIKKRGDIVINPNKEYIISIQNGILIMGEVD